MSNPSLHEWLQTPMGSYLLAQELAYFDEAVADVFGFNAVQVGLPGIDFMRACRIPLRVWADPTTDVAGRCPANAAEADPPDSDAGEAALPFIHAPLRTDFHALPLASNTIDLLVLPHVLEFSANPHQILREAERVLMPEGHLVISGFNPLSLWGLRRLVARRPREYPWAGKFMTLLRLKDWCKLLDLEVSAGKLACYVPPCSSEKWLERFRFMEKAGDRWWPISGGVYFLHAIKRVHGMRVLKPDWNGKRAPKARLAPLVQKAEPPRRCELSRKAA